MQKRIGGEHEKESEIYDLIIRNGLVIDGTGQGSRPADIAIKKGRICRMGKLTGASAVEEIDAADRIVTPGFIDIHSHCDRHIAELPGAENYLLQGVTTFLGGNCGGCRASVGLGKFLQDLEGRVGINFAALVGFGDLRKAAMADPTQPLPAKKELNKMKDLMETAMQEGAFGFSTGFEYIPDAFASQEEVEAIAKVAASYGGFYATHIRDEQTGVLTALAEAISVSAHTGISLEVSHLKACGAEVWGYGPIMVSMLAEARALGVNVAGDLYPYGASHTGFGQAFPNWALEGGIEKLRQRLEDPHLYLRISTYGQSQLRSRIGEDPSLIQIASYQGNPAYNGRTMADILREQNRDLSLVSLMDLVIEMYLKDQKTSVIYHYLNDADIKAMMRAPFVSIISDGEIQKFGEGTPHPRSYGSFPRVLAGMWGSNMFSPRGGYPKNDLFACGQNGPH